MEGGTNQIKKVTTFQYLTACKKTLSKKTSNYPLLKKIKIKEHYLILI